MTVWQCAFWGFFGASLPTGLEFWRAVRANGKNWPSGFSGSAFLLAELIRLWIGTGLAVAFQEQYTAATVAIAIGVSAPSIVEMMGKTLPVSLPGTPEEAENGGNGT